MIALIYSHHGDWHKAATAARCAKAFGVEPVIAVEQSEPAVRFDRFRTVRTSFKRRGNLNGREFIEGHLRLLMELADGPWVLKVDSDTMLSGTGWLDGVPESAWLAGPGDGGSRAFFGFCYAVGVRHIPDMLSDLGLLPDESRMMEDVILHRIASGRGRAVVFDMLSPGCPFRSFRFGEGYGFPKYPGGGATCFQSNHGMAAWDCYDAMNLYEKHLLGAGASQV